MGILFIFEDTRVDPNLWERVYGDNSVFTPGVRYMLELNENVELYTEYQFQLWNVNGKCYRISIFIVCFNFILCYTFHISLIPF